MKPLALAFALLGSTPAAHATCTVPGPTEGPLTQGGPRNATHLHVVLEVWADGADPAWLDEILSTIGDRGFPAAIIAKPSTVASAPDRMVAAADAGHEVVARLDAATVDLDDPKAIRAAAKQMADVLGSRPRSVWAPLPKRRTEAVLGQAGFRVVLVGDPTAGARPRHALKFENQMTESVVLPSGPYSDTPGSCGADPVMAPFTTAAADRATTAMRTAAKASWGVVRIGLDGGHGTPTDAAQLARWLDEVLVPSDAQVSTPAALKVAALRASSQDDDEQASSADTGGRLVPVEAVREAAEALATVDVIPRKLPGDLTPTEAFLAFALLATETTEGGVVRLGQLSGPRTLANSTLSIDEDHTVAADKVVAISRALLAGLPEDIPAALPVDGTLLNAGEMLLLLASTVRGDDPAVTHAVSHPDPHAEGLGWGSATLP